METWIDARKKQVTVRSTGKDGKEQIKTDHLNLPPDLANGMLPLIVENAAPDAQQTTVSMVVFTPAPRLVRCVISPAGETPFSVAGASLHASQYQLKFDLGAVTGTLAHLLGKQPPVIHFWILGGAAPLFLREQGPIYDDGPVLSIALAGLSWGN
jgi:hypothetical protein